MQAQPRIVALALLPSPVQVGRGRLRPVTIGGMTVLHGIQSPFVEGEEEPTALEAFVAGYILSKPHAEIVAEHQDGKLGDNALTWAKRNKVDCDQLRVAIYNIIREGFSSAANTEFPTGDKFTIVEDVVGDDGNGLGYLLTLVQTLCKNYHWTLEYVMDRPLITAFALTTAGRISEGAEWREFNYFERDREDEIRQHLANMKFG